MFKSTQKINLDVVGFWASTLCAIHCAALPILLTFSALGSLEILENHLIEGAMLTIAVALALASILPSYLNKHQRIQPLLITLLGFSFIFLGRITTIEGMEAIATVIGGVLVAVSHLLNSHYLKMWKRG